MRNNHPQEATVRQEVENINWATLLIFNSFEGSISKSVAQFFALIFAYIMLPTGPAKHNFSRIFEVFRFFSWSLLNGKKFPKTA